MIDHYIKSRFQDTKKKNISKIWASTFNNLAVISNMKTCLSKEAYTCQWKDAKRWPTNEQCFPPIETSQLICCANPLNSFYMRGSLVANELIIKIFDVNVYAKVITIWGQSIQEWVKWNLWKTAFLVCLIRPYHFRFFKGCLPQLSLGPFWNTLSHIYCEHHATLA